MKHCAWCKIINNVCAENWKRCFENYFFRVASSIHLKAMIVLTVMKDRGEARSSSGKKKVTPLV